MILTYKYCLMPTKGQHKILEGILEEERQLYNAALQERIDCYHKTGRTITYFDQNKSLTEWRQSDPAVAVLPLRLQRWTLKKLDNAFNGFFKRVKDKNGKAGYPRFKGYGHWKSFGFHEFIGIGLSDKRLYLGMPSGIRVHFHRPLPKNADIKSCVFTKNHKGWTVSFNVEVRCRGRISNRTVGIDVGINHLATLSNGKHIPNIRVAKCTE